MVYWVSASNFNMNTDAIIGGSDKDGLTLYIGRACHKSDQIPGKVRLSHKHLYIAHHGLEHVKKSNFEILCGVNVSWVECKNGAVPANAVPGGRTTCDEILYIGRKHYEGAVTPGKVQPSSGCLFIPFYGKEVGFRTYEVLVETKCPYPPNSCPPNSCTPNSCPPNSCSPKPCRSNIRLFHPTPFPSIPFLPSLSFQCAPRSCRCPPNSCVCRR